MDYIFLFLGVILIVQGAMSIYIYTEIKEERDHSENARQISLVTSILPFSVVLISLLLYYYKYLNINRLVLLILFTAILNTGGIFAIDYLLFKEKKDYDEKKNEDIKDITQLAYIISGIIIVFIAGVVMGTQMISENKNKEDIIKKQNPLSIPKKNLMQTPMANREDLMDDEMGTLFSDPTVLNTRIV